MIGVQYRGQRKDNKQWVYGFLDYNPIECDFIIHVVRDIPPSWAEPGGDIYSERFPVIPETVGQLHPHADENGKGIFEGDILAITTQDKQDILVVCRFGTVQRRMDTGHLCDITGFYFERPDGLNSFPIVKNYKGKHDLEMMQIVGNIYDTPDLFR